MSTPETIVPELIAKLDRMLRQVIILCDYIDKEGENIYMSYVKEKLNSVPQFDPKNKAIYNEFTDQLLETYGVDLKSANHLKYS